MTEPLDLEPIKARRAASTPAPWRRAAKDEPGDLGGNHAIVSAVAVVLNRRLDEDGPMWIAEPVVGYFSGYAIENEADADLIAHAPADIDALTAEVERLREAVWIGLDQLKWREHSGRGDEDALREMSELSGLRPTPPQAT